MHYLPEIVVHVETELHDINEGVGNVTVIVEIDGNLCVALKSCYRVNRNRFHLSRSPSYLGRAGKGLSLF